MKKASFILVVCILAVLMKGCFVDTFNYPIGAWKSEELGIDIYFENTRGRGTLLIDGVANDIISIFVVSGGLIIAYPRENESDELIQIMFGSLRNRFGGNRIDYTITWKNGEYLEIPIVYTFVRANPT